VPRTNVLLSDVLPVADGGVWSRWPLPQHPQSNLAAAQNDSEKVLSLTKDVKEKNLLIGKLRHEGKLALQD
jgi:hypothetical protein